jgi:hypothetical protein
MKVQLTTKGNTEITYDVRTERAYEASIKALGTIVKTATSGYNKRMWVEGDKVAEAKAIDKNKPAYRRPAAPRRNDTLSGWTEDQEDGIAPLPKPFDSAQAEQSKQEARETIADAEVWAFVDACAKLVSNYNHEIRFPNLIDGSPIDELIKGWVAAL